MDEDLQHLAAQALDAAVAFVAIALHLQTEARTNLGQLGTELCSRASGHRKGVLSLAMIARSPDNYTSPKPLPPQRHCS